MRAMLQTISSAKGLVNDDSDAVSCVQAGGQIHLRDAGPFKIAESSHTWAINKPTEVKGPVLGIAK